jgi:predicted DNA-binding transcriptional regulator YafY
MSYTRVHRLFRIVTLIQAKSTWTAKSLAQECGIDERTIFRDLKELEGVGVPIIFDSATGGYRIAGDFFLPPLQLSTDEALALTLLCEQVAEPEQIAYMLPAWKALAKIQSHLPTSVREEVSELSRSIAIRISASVPADGHDDVYRRMMLAISSRTALVCRYESTDRTSAEEDFDFEPYTLFFCVRAWYVIGLHHGRNALRSLKLNRFTRVTATKRRYEIPGDFSVEGYFGNAWRMIKGDREHDVELEFTPAFAQTVGDTRWHHTQTIDHHEDGSATFKCRVAGFDEIVWWILSHGPNCRVVSPPELRDKVRELAKSTAALYEA